MKNKIFNFFSTKNNSNENNGEELNAILLFIVNNIDNMGKHYASKNSNSKLKANKKSNAFLLDLYYKYASKDKSNIGIFNSIQDEFFNLNILIFGGVFYILMTTCVLPLFSSYFNI